MKLVELILVGRGQARHKLCPFALAYGNIIVAIHLRHVFRHGADLAVHVLDVAGQTGDVIRHQPYLPGHIVHKARHESAPAQCGKCKDPDGRVS